MNPLSARLRFKLRPLVNFSTIICIFGVLAFIFSQFEWWLIGDVIAISVLFYFNFYVLERRAIGLRCPGCLKYIATNTPWICGFCKGENRQPDDFPFVHHCEHCSAQPKAYKCHHNTGDTKCGEIIFLSSDMLKENHAFCLNTEKQPLPMDKIAERKEEKEAKLHELEMEDLAIKLNAARQVTALGKKKTPSEEIEESFEKHHARFMGTREFALRQRAINAEKFKNDPDMLRFANEALDDWERERL